jgi:hypothetical protein
MSRRALLLGLAGLCAAASLLFALAAHDARAWHDQLAAGDAAYAVSPGPQNVWRPVPALPYDPIGRVLAVNDDVAFRQASAGFWPADRVGRTLDDGGAGQRTRSVAEAALVGVSRGGPNARAARGENMLGILSSYDSTSSSGTDSAPLATSLAAFRSAVTLDPANVAAGFNLELVLRLTRATGARQGSGSTPGGPSGHRAGASESPPGSGY